MKKQPGRPPLVEQGKIIRSHISGKDYEKIARLARAQKKSMSGIVRKYISAGLKEQA